MLTRKRFLNLLISGAAVSALMTGARSIATAQTVVGNQLLAGVAKKVITPSTANLAAYAQYDRRLSGEVKQDIHARIIVLGNPSGAKLVLLSAELLSMPNYDELTAKISRTYKIDKTACILSVTGNHQAPTLGVRNPAVQKIEAEMVETILTGVGEAIAAMKPAKMALAQGSSNINAHFGRQTSAGLSHMPDFGKFADKDLSVLRIDDAAGTTLALFVTYGMQCNMMRDSSDKLSGDIAGNISAYIEKRLGFMCAWSVGAAADVYPLTTSTLNTPVYDASGKLTIERQTISENAASNLCNYLTSVQGLDIINVYNRITRFSDTFTVRHGEERVSVRGKRGQVSHRLHLAVVNADIAFAAVNSITSAGLGKMVKDALPYRVAFLSSEGDVVGYVVDSDTDPAGVAGSNSVTADVWQSEKIYLEGFRKLATRKLAKG